MSPENISPHAGLEERLQFETLIADLSSKFVNLPAGEVDREIMDAERRICVLLGLDISAIWQWSAGPPGCFTLTHYYSAQDGPQPSMPLSDTDFPWFRQLMIEGRIVPVSSLEKMPAEAALDRENCRRLGIKSNLCLPLVVGGEPPLGILGLNTTRAERDWPDTLVQRLRLVAQIIANALSRKRADEALRETRKRLSLAADDLEDRLRFESLISDLSARMVVATSTEVDQEIERALNTLLHFFRCERCGLLEVIREGNIVRITHARYAEGVEEVPRTLNLAPPFPWTIPRIVDLGQHVSFCSIDELPAEAAVDRASWEGMGTKSSLNIPIFSAGSVHHIIVIHSIREERRWPESYVPRLRMLGEIFANAVERKRADYALRESEERMTLAADAADFGVWGWNIAANQVWGSERWLRQFGFASSDHVSLKNVFQRIHPDDRGTVEREVRRTLVNLSDYVGEFRVVLPDGTQRWIASRGRGYPDANGAPARMLGAAIDITERKRAEESFRASEARLQAGSDLAGLGYFEADYASRTCFLDNRFRQICAIPNDVQQGLDPVAFWLDRIHPEDRERVQAEREALREGKADQISTEYRYFHPVLGQRWLHHLARLAERPDGAGGIRTFGVIRDITEHKQLAEEQAEDSRFGNLIADLSSKFVNLPAAEVDNAIEDAQRRVCEFLGLDLSALWQPVNGTADEYRLTHHYRSMGGPPITRMSAKDNFPWCHQQLLAGNVIAVSAVDKLPPEAARDQEVWRHFGIKTSLTVPMSTGGAFAIGFLSFNDITREREWPGKLVNRLQMIAQIFANALARKLADQQLRESEEVNRATFEQAGVGIAHVGTDGRWLRVNDKLCAILGYPREELMQLTFQSITHPDDLESDLDLMRQVLSGGIGNYSMAKRYFRKDRSLVWANLTVSLVRNEAGGPKHFISVVEDITERRRTEQEMQRLRLQLWHADRVAQTGAITASLAHELNQPLTGILSTSQAGLRFLTSGNADATLIREILTNIVHDTKRAGAVINGLRAMLRRKETDREPVSLADTIQGVLNLVHSELIARQVEYHLRPEPDLRVLADKAQIQQVLLNLVMNALEAMQSQPPERRRLELTFGRTNSGEAIVAVRDSGPGIPEDQHEKLFMAFWTTKPQGMGIGLSISYSIIESHGGRLWCDNNPDGGATFSFTLPVGDRKGRSDGGVE